MFRPDEQSFLHQLILFINNAKPFGYQGVPHEQIPFNNFLFVSFAILLYQLDWHLAKEDQDLFTVLTPYEKWLLEPESFNYEQFNPQWLADSMSQSTMLNRLKNIPEIGKLLQQHLSQHFTEPLAKFYFDHFAKNPPNINQTK